MCACGCGQAVTQWGNKTRKYIHGHKIRDMWKDKTYRTWHISLFEGKNNPMHGKFGENHPAYKHKKSKKFRNDSSKRMLDRMSKGERKTTNIEIILSKILDEINVEHYPQHLMYNKFVVDEYLPDSGLIVEAYGGYWHGDPHKFFKLDKIQLKNQKRDDSRIKYLNKCGHIVLVLWENELLHHIDLCKVAILDTIKFIQTN